MQAIKRGNERYLPTRKAKDDYVSLGVWWRSIFILFGLSPVNSCVKLVEVFSFSCYFLAYHDNFVIFLCILATKIELKNDMQKNNKILIIEDDPHIVELLEIHLGDLGYELKQAADGVAGVEKFEEDEYALVILDLMLPKLDGFEVCKQIRAQNTYTPILMLTSRAEELDKVLGLELGADDYITKPLSIRELVARIKAIFRRIEADKEKATGNSKSKELIFGDLKIYLEKRKYSWIKRPSI